MRDTSTLLAAIDVRVPDRSDAPKVIPAGDTALVIDFGDRADMQLSVKVLSLARRLNARQIPGVVETVPTIRSLIIYYEPLYLATEVLQEQVVELLDDAQDAQMPPRTWRLPVCYDAAVALDIADVAGRSGLSPRQVVERHSSVVYHVYMLGFLPGLAYLGDVLGELALPRRETPRRSIPAGSVGIAGTMTCVYPRDTPCGWHLIGRSPVPLWDLNRVGGALLAAGDNVIFQPLSLREYERDLALLSSSTGRTTLIQNVA